MNNPNTHDQVISEHCAYFLFINVDTIPIRKLLQFVKARFVHTNTKFIIYNDWIPFLL